MGYTDERREVECVDGGQVASITFLQWGQEQNKVMRVELSRDFEVEETPIKLFRQRIKQEQRDRHSRRFSLKDSIRQHIQVIDPLNEQLQEYKDSIEKPRALPKSKAYQRMRKYISEQQRKLKHIRMHQIFATERTFKTESMAEFEAECVEPQHMLTAIPEVGTLFRNQVRDTMIHENNLLNKALETKVESLQDTIRRLNLSKSDMVESKVSASSDDVDLDQKIALHRQRNKRLLLTLQDQKSGIQEKEVKDSKRSFYSSNPPLLALHKPKPIERRKIRLERLKSVPILIGDKVERVCPSISLLIEFRNLNKLKEKKEAQLDSLLKNQHQNSIQNKTDKSTFYTQQVQFRSMNPASQFRLRRVMNDKLQHRLKVSQDQSIHFSDFLTHLKDSRFLVCGPLQEIFEELRRVFLDGKILREGDFDSILERHKDREELRQARNVSVIKRIRNMMV